MSMSFALETNVNNYCTKGNDLACLRIAYARDGMPYLRGLMTGLACFLRMQGHTRDDVMLGINAALVLVTGSDVTADALYDFSTR